MSGQGGPLIQARDVGRNIRLSETLHLGARRHRVNSPS